MSRPAFRNHKAYKNLGRPSHYRPEHAKIILDAAAEGKSLSSAAARIGIARTKLYEWAEYHEDIRDAMDRAKAIRTEFWEKAAIDLVNERTAQGGSAITGGSAQIMQFMLRTHAQDEYFVQAERSSSALLEDLITAAINLRVERLMPKTIDHEPAPAEGEKPAKEE